MLSLLLLVLAAGCEKDSACKGDRICESGRCMSPVAPPSEPSPDAGVATPAPAPASGRAPLRVEDPNRPAPSRVETPPAPPTPEPPSRVVGLVGVTAGLISAGTLLGGAIGATASGGVRFRSGVGVVGVALIDYAPF